jgi:hypothetical protein
MRKTDLPIVSPCPRKFATLEPIDDARGHCDECNLTVHNFSAMTEKAALEAWKRRDAHFCVNYQCDAEGNILFADTPRKPAIVPVTRLTSKRKAATLAASLLLAACGGSNSDAPEWTGELSAPPDAAQPEKKANGGPDASPPQPMEMGGVAMPLDAGAPEQPDSGDTDAEPPAKPDAGKPDSSTT